LTAGRRLAACGSLLSASVAWWSLTGDQTRRVPSHLAVYGLAFAVYLVALRSARGVSRRGLGVALALAVAWRLALVTAPPLLSDDVYRSVWEGRIQLHGGNPYSLCDRPDAPRWLALRDAVWENVNHQDFPAVYPPLWQLAARLVVTLDDSVTAIKAFLVVCELATLAVLAVLVRRRGQPAERLLVLAWNPLALVEIAGSGHNEALGLLLVVLALAALDAGRGLASAVAVGLGVQAKLLPGLLAIAWSRRYRPLHVLAAVAAAVLLVLPYAAAGPDLWWSLGQYAERWRFNETAFALLASATGSHAAAVRLSAVLVVLVAGVLAVRRVEPASGALVVVAATLFLAPNVLPWYALWLLPLLVLRDAPAALLFTGTVGLVYLVYLGWNEGGPWALGWGWRALEYVPCLAVAIRPARWRRRPLSTAPVVESELPRA
jgi:hypothetical protein